MEEKKEKKHHFLKKKIHTEEFDKNRLSECNSRVQTGWSETGREVNREDVRGSEAQECVCVCV